MIFFNKKIFTREYLVEELDKKHTGTLMDWLRIARRRGIYCDASTYLYASKELIISILNTREHFPNKQERKVDRIRKIKQKQNR